MIALKSSLRKFYGRHHDLVNSYGITMSQITTDMFKLRFTPYTGAAGILLHVNGKFTIGKL
jgi:hypothetical protein